MKLIIKIIPIIFFCLFSLKSFAGVTYSNGDRLDISRNNMPLVHSWNNDGSKLFVGGIGGILMVWMGVSIIRHRIAAVNEVVLSESSLLAGVMLSAGNPYFLIWWATVGSSLVIRSVEYGFVGVLLFGICHWLCDLVWLWLLSLLAYRASSIFGGTFVRITSLVSGSFLLFIGFRFCYQALITMDLL